jgi:hypothetical protein
MTDRNCIDPLAGPGDHFHALDVDVDGAIYVEIKMVPSIVA